MEQSFGSKEEIFGFIQAEFQNEHIQFSQVLQSMTDKIVMQTLDHTMTITNICIKNSDLVITCLLGYSNGHYLTVKPPLSTSFLELVNGHKNSVKIDLIPPSYALNIELKLKDYKLFSSKQIQAQFLKDMQEIYCNLTNALQILGSKSKFNKIQQILKKEKNHLKKESVDIIRQFRNNTFEFSIPQKSIQIQKKVALQEVKKIDQIESMRENLRLKKGGYCYIEPFRCWITKQGSQDYTEEILAVKKSRMTNDPNIQQKIQKQLNIVKKISNSEHTCRYYNSPETQNIYMTYIPKTLREYISRKNQNCDLDVKKILSFSKQIVSGVRNLHESGIIHRDLKPENILISDNDSVHIIDFGESTTSECTNRNVNLGSTFPYSPMQCAVGTQQGFNNFQIDLWSVNIILYEMVFKSLPLSFNKSISSEVIEDWMTSPLFTTYQHYCKGKGIRGAAELISLISMAGLNVKQSQRLSLNAIDAILSLTEQYYRRCMKITDI